MKVACLIIAYKEPELADRLVKVMAAHNDFDCWIHIDKKTDIKAYEHLQKLPRHGLLKKGYRLTGRVLVA